MGNSCVMVAANSVIAGLTSKNNWDDPEHKTLRRSSENGVLMIIHKNELVEDEPNLPISLDYQHFMSIITPTGTPLLKNTCCTFL